MNFEKKKLNILPNILISVIVIFMIVTITYCSVKIWRLSNEGDYETSVTSESFDLSEEISEKEDIEKIEDETNESDTSVNTESADNEEISISVVKSENEENETRSPFPAIDGNVSIFSSIKEYEE